MNIPMDNPDPKSNLIEFKRGKREGTIEPVRAAYDSCKHERVMVDEATRTVSCRTCKTPLDAFAVLYELAHKQRRWLDELDHWDAYRESKLADRYDLQWEKDQGEVKHPPTDPASLAIWQSFHRYLGDTFCGMYRRKRGKRNGPEWYGRTTTGGVFSHEWVRQRLLPKTEKPA